MNSGYSVLYKRELRKHFEYLENKYGYTYSSTGHYYQKSDIRLYIRFEPDSVSVDLWLINEPEYTKLPISWFLEIAQEKKQPDLSNFASVDETISAYAKFFEEKINRITNELPKLLLPALKLLFETSLIKTRLSKDEILKSDDFKKIYDYIITRDLTWNM